MRAVTRPSFEASIFLPLLSHLLFPLYSHLPFLSVSYRSYLPFPPELSSAVKRWQKIIIAVSDWEIEVDAACHVLHFNYLKGTSELIVSSPLIALVITSCELARWACIVQVLAWAHVGDTATATISYGDRCSQCSQLVVMDPLTSITIAPYHTNQRKWWIAEKKEQLSNTMTKYEFREFQYRIFFGRQWKLLFGCVMSIRRFILGICLVQSIVESRTGWGSIKKSGMVKNKNRHYFGC